MAGRDWHGITVADGVSDDLLLRIYSIPGISISQELPDSLTFSFYPQTENSPTQGEFRDALSDVALVDSKHTILGTSFSIEPLLETRQEGERPWDFLPWWDIVLQRLRDLVSRHNIPAPTILDFEKDILRGSAFILMSTRTQAIDQDDYDNSTLPYYYPEAERLLTALSHLNQKSVYDLYLDWLVSFDGINIQYFRYSFGEHVASAALGKKLLVNRPLFGIQIPTWWSIAPGTFNVCVSKSPQDEFGPVLCTLVIEHDESAISASVTIYAKADRNTHYKCLKMTSSKDSAMRRLINEAKNAGERLFCERLQGQDVADFVVGLCRKQYASAVRSQMEDVMANCFRR